MQCPCESGKPYSECCQIHHLGSLAPTAEALMRSRYSAYVLLSQNPAMTDYLLRTWHPDTRPEHMDGSPAIKWLGLQIKRSQTIAENMAIVEFVARYKYTDNLGGKAERLHEASHFTRLDDCWYYLNGEFD